MSTENLEFKTFPNLKEMEVRISFGTKLSVKFMSPEGEYIDGDIEVIIDENGNNIVVQTFWPDNEGRKNVLYHYDENAPTKEDSETVKKLKKLSSRKPSWE